MVTFRFCSPALAVRVRTLHPNNFGGDIVKKVFSFSLAVALAISFLLGSAFASSGSADSSVDPETFVYGDRADGSDTMMELSLLDGSVIEVPSRLQGDNFVIAKNEFGYYNIWRFDSIAGVYEGARNVTYELASGRFTGGAFCNGYPVPLEELGWDLTTYQYVFCFLQSDYNYIHVYAGSEPGYMKQTSSSTNYYFTDAYSARYYYGDGSWTNVSTSPAGGNTSLRPFSLNYVDSNFEIEFKYGEPEFISSSFSLMPSLEWSEFQEVTTDLEILSFGEVVYQSFAYSDVPNDDEPDPDVTEDSFLDWVADWFVSGVFSTVSKLLKSVSYWFNTGYGVADLISVFDQTDNGWFSETNRLAIDSVGSGT